MNLNQNIPTIFAISLAESVGLMEKNPTEPFTIGNQTMRLAAFQQMAMGCEFDECLIAYHGADLSEEQKVALQVIHTSTAPWLIGHVISELLENVKDDKGKAAELILNQLIKGGIVDPEVGKGLLLRLEVVDSKTGKKKE